MSLSTLSELLLLSDKIHVVRGMSLLLAILETCHHLLEELDALVLGGAVLREAGYMTFDMS